MDKARLKQKIVHEFGEYLQVFFFLAPLFVAFSTYRMLVLGRFEDTLFTYGTAIFNALVMAKIILIGEYIGLGKRHECRPLIYPTIFKSLWFTLLVAVFRVLEGGVRGLLHGEGLAGAVAVVNGRSLNEVLGWSLVMFCAFLPFFALRETARIAGANTLKDLFFRPRGPAASDPAPQAPRVIADPDGRLSY
jgi:hypothetical protein